ncbi:ferredoxin--NADP reductase [Williamsia sterculiae]|uniref:3-ketosteroid 9alpha-monooxygenase subunit B n=1 Tax=Williamsia sterculiae TaxID=1344003 RepID=A0A1N7GQI1_9NOCA|nr:ferredoxin--NADP reductase [Williamsia sterculiae]SIS14780.1 3-ketosteroid 9alpha-monooxygenase subunit B [Williamsia sterculiae]
MSSPTPPGPRSVILTVTDVIEESVDAKSLVFAVPEESRGSFDYRPGQFLTLRIPSDRTGSVARCYSLASSPSLDPAPKVTVKRTVDGYGSNWLCDNVAVGDELESLPPSGVFTPADLSAPLLLAAAGSGITPVISILKSALRAGSPAVTLLYANRGETDVIFAEELRHLQAAHPDRVLVVHWLESLQGLPTAQTLASVFAPFRGRETFMCGPEPFMAAVHDALAAAGFAHATVHAEVFTSLSGDPFAEREHVEVTAAEVASASTAEVELDGEVHELAWPKSQTLVDIMLDAGIDVPYSCREGECGSCACTVTDGSVEMDNPGALDEEDIADGYILGCQAHPTSPVVHIAF